MLDHHSYYLISARPETYLTVNREWLESVFKTISCPECWSILPPFQNSCPDVVVDERPKGLKPIPIPMFFDIEFVSIDLMSVLSKHCDSWVFGRIHDPGGLVKTHYAAVTRPCGRVALRGDERSTERPCESCGRRCAGLFGQWWCKASDVGDRLAIANDGGGGMMARGDFIESWPETLRKRMRKRLLKIEVRE